METPDVRIGWLRMLAKVYARHPGDLYRDILTDIDRLIKSAEAEREGRREGCSPQESPSKNAASEALPLPADGPRASRVRNTR